MQGLGPYNTSIKKVEKEAKDLAKNVNDLCGIYAFLFLLLIKQIFWSYWSSLVKNLFIVLRWLYTFLFIFLLKNKDCNVITLW